MNLNFIKQSKTMILGLALMFSLPAWADSDFYLNVINNSDYNYRVTGADAGGNHNWDSRDLNGSTVEAHQSKRLISSATSRVGHQNFRVYPIKNIANHSVVKGSELHQGEQWQNEVIKMEIQKEGNVVVYNLEGMQALWSLWEQGVGKPSISRLAFQEDGNLVAYNDHQEAVWSSGTNGELNATLVLQGDGNVVIYSSEEADHRALWSTDTRRGQFFLWKSPSSDLAFLEPQTTGEQLGWIEDGNAIDMLINQDGTIELAVTQGIIQNTTNNFFVTLDVTVNNNSTDSLSIKVPKCYSQDSRQVRSACVDTEGEFKDKEYATIMPGTSQTLSLHLRSLDIHFYRFFPRLNIEVQNQRTGNYCSIDAPGMYKDEDSARDQYEFMGAAGTQFPMSMIVGDGYFAYKFSDVIKEAQYAIVYINDRDGFFAAQGTKKTESVAFQIDQCG